MKFSPSDLFAFIDLASKSTYAAGKPPLKHSERKDFTEWEFAQGKWSYRDSYAGYTKSTGQEIVRYDGEIVWSNSYCGGMTEGNESQAHTAFDFLKLAISQDEKAFQSLRGPAQFTKGDWLYRYTQEGDITNYHGYEEILYKGAVVFFHRTIGGMVIHKQS